MHSRISNCMCTNQGSSIKQEQTDILQFLDSLLDIDKFMVTKLDPSHKNIGIELPLGQILQSFVASGSRTSLANMAILTKI